MRLIINTIVVVLSIINLYCDNKNNQIDNNKNIDTSKLESEFVKVSSFDRDIIYSKSKPTEYSCGGMGSIYSVLYKNGLAIDTIDENFGMHVIGKDSIIVWSVKDVTNDPFEGISADPTNYTLITKDRKIILNNMLPDFDNYFSSPAIIDNILYYWGLKYSEGRESIKLTAIKYNFSSKEIDSLYLENTFNEGTDNWNSFFQPIKEQDYIVYERDEKIWLIDKKGFKIDTLIIKE